MCLDSICNQTLKEIEIICIEDASQDASLSILRDYSIKDCRIVVVQNNHNIGVAAARNLGISLAHGEYLAILDSDDYFQFDMLEIMYQKSLQTRCDVCVCNICWIDALSGICDIRLTSDIGYIPDYFLGKFHPSFHPNDVPDHIFRFFATASFCRLYRKKFIESHNLIFQNLPNCNDVFFGQISLVLANILTYVPDRLVNYRFNRKGQISSQRSKQPLCIHSALKAIYDRLHKENLWDLYRKSFFEYAIESIWVNMNTSTTSVRKYALKFWRDTGLNSLRMKNCKVFDFVTRIAYRKWCVLQSQNFLSDDVNNQDDFLLYQKFFGEISKVKKHCALWGWGKNGKIFYDIARRYQFPIIEIYDHDPIKWNVSFPRVVPYEQKCKLVDIIIVTNTRFMNEICNTICVLGEEMTVFDFDLYKKYGVNFQNCMVRFHENGIRRTI